ncbi:MAG: response regulator [Xanthobacter sp.]
MEAGPSGRDAILLVEDEPIVALAARHALEDMGFHVATASHGAAALHHARSALGGSPAVQAGNAPAGSTTPQALPEAAPLPAASLSTPLSCSLLLAIVDVGLPDMSGIAVAQALRELAPKLPIIIASGHAWEELEEELSSLSAIFRLDKPYSGASLRNALCRLGIAFPQPES